MRASILSLAVRGAALACSGTALADAGAILQAIIEAESQRLDGVKTLIIDKSMLGVRMQEKLETVRVQAPDGTSLQVLRRLSPGEQAGRAAESGMDARSMREAADALDSQRASVDQAFDQELRAAGMAPGLQQALLTPPPDQPWLSPDPGDMLGMYAFMLRAGAEGLDQQARGREGSVADAASAPLEAMDLARELEVIGAEVVDGVHTRHLRAEGLQRTQTVNGEQFTLHSADLWVDETRLVTVRMRFEGEMESAGERQQVVIERADRDHRAVPGSGLLEPYHQVLTLQGVMSEAQQAEMREASARLDELEARMAEMPASQQQMLRRQMGPQMETLRTLAAGGGLEVVTQVHEIRVNDPDFDALVAGPLPVAAGPLTADPAPDEQDRDSAVPTLAEQQRCLEQRAAAAQEAEQKKRGIGRLFGAVERVAARARNFRVLQAIDDAATADATAADIAAAAEDLGLTETDIEACSRY